jgi:hypothetical protein
LKKLLVCLCQIEVKIVELPPQTCKTEPEFDSLSIHHKSARTCEERMFYFRPVLSFAGREPELLRMSEILQDFRIRYQRRDAFRSDVSLNDRVDHRRAKVIPPFVTRRSLSESRDKLFL